jgi:hypothetical protein
VCAYLALIGFIFDPDAWLGNAIIGTSKNTRRIHCKSWKRNRRQPVRSQERALLGSLIQTIERNQNARAQPYLPTSLLAPDPI